MPTPAMPGPAAPDPAAPARPRVFLVRHGETEWNTIDRLLSFTDMVLNERGEGQARRLGEELAAEGIVFDRVLCSPLVRATRTAELVLGHLARTPAMELDPRLVEVGFGPFEGWTRDAIAADEAAMAWRMGVDHPGAETNVEVDARARAVWADLPVRGTTLVVSHGRFLRSVIATCVLELDLVGAARMRMRNCRPAIVEPGPEPLLLSLNGGPSYRL